MRKVEDKKVSNRVNILNGAEFHRLLATLHKFIHIQNRTNFKIKKIFNAKNITMHMRIH